MSDYKVDDVLAKYVELRDKKATAKAKYDNYVGDIDVKLDRLEAWLLAQMEKTGVSQFKSEHGTAYVQEKVKCSGSDWPTTWRWIKDNDRFDLLEKRVSSKTAKEVFEETGEYPPGINVYSEREVTVRRA